MSKFLTKKLYIIFKAINIFELMEISETVYERVVERFYLKNLLKHILTLSVTE